VADGVRALPDFAADILADRIYKQFIFNALIHAALQVGIAIHQRFRLVQRIGQYEKDRPDNRVLARFAHGAGGHITPPVFFNMCKVAIQVLLAQLRRARTITANDKKAWLAGFFYNGRRI